GCLVAGHDEGENIGADLGFAQAFSGVWIDRRKEEGENIVWSAVSPLREPAASGGDQVVDRALEEPESRSYPQMIETGDPARQPEEIEWVDPADRLKIGDHGKPGLLRVAAEAVRKDGALEHVERQARYFRGDVDRFPISAPPALDQRIGSIHHRGRELGDCPPRKQRSGSAPLRPPLITLSAPKPLAQAARQHTALQA